MSGLEAVGAAASIVQLVDIGVRLAFALSTVCQKLRDHPEKLNKRLQSIEQLIEITKSIASTPALDKKLIRSVVSETIIDAKALLDLLEPLAAETNDGRGARCWKAFCSIAKENRIIGLFDQVEKRKTALILCIGVATSSILNTVDKSVLDLASNTRNAFNKIPSIEQSVEQIATKLEGIMVEGRLVERNHAAPTAATLRAVELALPRLDNKLEEAGVLQKALFELAKSIKNSLEPESIFDEIGSLTPPACPSLSVSMPKFSRSHSRNDAITGSLTQKTERQFIVPVSQNTLFTGRSNIIDQIFTFFSSNDNEQKRLVLTGLGGVGKTQIATAYTYSSYSDNVYSCVFWIFASQRDHTIKSLTKVAKSLGLEAGPALANEPDSADSIPPMVDTLIRWLSREQAPKWLLVFDNVDDLDTFDVSIFFPRVPSGDILITSRRQQAARFGHQIMVDVMQPEEAVELLQKCSRLAALSNDPAPWELTEALGYLPLALDQAGAYIAEQGIDFATYMDVYTDSREYLLRHKPPKAVWSYEETVFTTWEISFSAISQSDLLAARLLDVAAFLNSDDIPLGLLCALAQESVPDKRLLLQDFVNFVSNRSDYSQIVGPLSDDFKVPKFKIQLAIGKLSSLSLIQHKPQSQSISVHPLVHFWLRERQSESERLRHARDAIRLTLPALVNAYDLSQFSKAEIIYPHMFICLEHVHTMPGLLDATEIHKIGACIIALDAWVPISFDAGTLLKADRFYDLVRERNSQTVWAIPEAMLMMRQALRLKSLGLHAKTCELCDQYFNVFEQRTRLDKIYAASMVRTAGPCYFRQGDYDGAERVYERIDDSLDTTGVMLARKQLVLGAIKIDRALAHDAEKLFLSFVSRLRQGIGEEHFLLSVWHWLLSFSYIAQGRYREAEDTVRPRLMKRFEQLVAGNIRFAFSDYELTEAFTRILREQMRFTEAIDFLEDVLAKTALKLPPPARALGELSLVLTRLERAMSLLKDVDLAEQDSKIADAEKLLHDALETFQNAAYAYEIEWNRGTWVFKHFPAMIQEHQWHLEQLASKSILENPTTEVAESAKARSSIHIQSIKTPESTACPHTGAAVNRRGRFCT